MKHECKSCVCERKAERDIDIYVPVLVKGFAEVGEIQTKCEGPCSVIHGSHHCPGRHDANACFVICQKVKVEVPVTFGAITEVDEYKVDADFVAEGFDARLGERCRDRDDKGDRGDRSEREKCNQCAESANRHTVGLDEDDRVNKHSKRF